MTEKPEKENIALVANFTFVARDSETKKSAPVNQLVPETEAEMSLFAEGESRNEHRKQRRQQGSLDASKEAVNQKRLKDILAEVGRRCLNVASRICGKIVWKFIITKFL